MSSPSSTEAYIIIRQDENGQPVEIIPYNEDTATYVATTIHVCEGMLKTSTVKDAFKKLAEGFDPKPSGDLPKDDVVEIFIEKILKRFPLVFVDDSRTNPNQIASHHRRAWADDHNGFDTRNQAIKLNGPRVRDMCVAGKEAQESNDPDSDEQKRFRAFLFIFATSFLHELGHVFVTFLGLGDVDTPPHVDAHAGGSSQGDIGEAGSFLEEEIFGGVMSVMRNPDKGNDQAGICLLYREGGSSIILQEAIDDIIKYEFNFPMRHLGDRGSGPLKTLGYGIPRPVTSRDPMNAPATSELLAKHEANPFKWRKELEKLMAENPNPGEFGKDHEAVMRQVPFKPDLRFKGVPKPRAQATK